MIPDDQDDLWQLLGQARSTVVSPFFARKVVRTIRLAPETAWKGWRLWLLRYWQLPAMAACGLAVAAGAMWQRPAREPAAFASSSTAAAPTPATSPASAPGALVAIAQNPAAGVDFGVIGHLDELLDSEQNSVWLGGDTY